MNDVRPSAGVPPPPDDAPPASVQQWVPRVERSADAVSLSAARGLHDLLDRAPPAPRTGDELPVLWHWLAFLPRARQSTLGADGHPPTGTFLPPMADRRRMFSGGRVAMNAPIEVGRPLRRSSTVTSVERKRGRTGELTFVEVTSEITGDVAEGSEPWGRSAGDVIAADATPLLHERVDLVYLPRTSTPVAPTVAAAQDWDVEHVVAMSTSLLFRFSALTYNAHRIHYDRDFAVGVEGYPALVVHGPLQALLLAQLAASLHPASTVVTFEFRAVAPAYDTADLVLRARTGEHLGGGNAVVELGAFSAGIQTMRATATLRRR